MGKEFLLGDGGQEDCYKSLSNTLVIYKQKLGLVVFKLIVKSSS